MNVGLFGGSFDPPHLGHRQVAEKAFESLQLDRLIWIPANRSPHKTAGSQTDPGHRLALTKLAAAGHPRFEVSDIEMRRPPPSYMVQTLEELREEMPETKFFLLIGEDSLAGFCSWKSPDRIQDLATLAVYPRGGSRSGPELKNPIVWIRSPEFEMSSTSIRARLGRGLPVDGMVTEPVLSYLREHNLFAR